jgi:DNA-binding XRE family transcriptional regulator
MGGAVFVVTSFSGSHRAYGNVRCYAVAHETSCVRLMRRRILGPPMNATTAGQRLRRWRKARGLTQRALADQIQSDQSRICRIEKGEIAPDLAEAIRLAKLAKNLGGRGRLPVDMWLQELKESA